MTRLSRRKIATMQKPTFSATVNDTFFRPLMEALAASVGHHPCREISDAQWLRMGVQRVLEGSESGRAFLQEHGLRFETTPSYATYFASLRSQRRCDLARAVNSRLIAAVEAKSANRLADIPELSRYACFAADGHWHRAAVHDPRHKDAKMAVGHFYGLNLHTHVLRHLTAGQGLHEHDMSALKRIQPKGLRQETPKGTRALIVYDKAGIDFDYWGRCRRDCALYFLSRVKENMVFEWIADLEWDKADARNRGVLVDCKVRSREGHLLRLVIYQDGITGQVYEFLTNEVDLPPGVIAELYRRRWEAEKVFDQIKNKLGQKKAWGSTMAAKEAQALLIAITHNLLLCYEQHLEKSHDLKNTAEDERRAKRVEGQTCAETESLVSSLVLNVRRATQRSVKFIRWLRQAMRETLTEAAALARLRQLYAVL